MTRDEALALYHPIRASVRRILSAAVPVRNRSDLMRAAKLLGLWTDGQIALPEGSEAVEMLGDIALFEPNQRGRRAYDVFLSDKARQLDPADLELAQRMGKAFFSLFRCTMRHEIAGVWIDDLLDGDQSLWLMDESMEASPLTEHPFGMRVFDAGAFHVGFSIVVPSDDEKTQFSIQGVTRNGRTPFRHSLAVTLFGDSLRESVSLSPELEDAFTSVFAGLVESGAVSRRKLPTQPTSRKAKTRKRD